MFIHMCVVCVLEYICMYELLVLKSARSEDVAAVSLVVTRHAG